jgi:molybdopterin-guanine dinucleotide biosynthesis protein A
MKGFDAYILIGGRSSRLGQDKAAAELGGRTLAERALETVSAALPVTRVTFVAANEAQFAIQAIVAGGRFVFDLVEGRGPLGGLHAALADTRAEWIFLMACDYPFISSEFIRLLIEKDRSGFGAVVPTQFDGRMQPLTALYRVETARPVVQEIIDRPRVPPPLNEIVKELKPLIVTPSDYRHLAGSEGFFTNINTGVDLDLAREIERKLSAEK